MDHTDWSSTSELDVRNASSDDIVARLSLTVSDVIAWVTRNGLPGNLLPGGVVRGTHRGNASDKSLFEITREGRQILAP